MSLLNMYNPTQWQLDEERKLQRAQESIMKSQWLLETRSFALFDLESTHLDADFGRLICACVKPLGEPPVIFSTRKGDKKIAGQIRDELKKYHYIAGWYSSRFDMPFLSARLVKQGLERIGLSRHLDLYYTSREHFKFASHRQAAVARSLNMRAERTEVVGDEWLAAAEGSRSAVKYIVDHCVADMEDLESIFHHLIQFRNLGSTPLRQW